MAETGVRRTPEEEHLADQETLLQDLTERLATKEAEFATLGVEFDRFRAAYLAKFAPLYAELDRLEAKIARLLADHYGADEAPESQAAQERADAAEACAEESASGIWALGAFVEIRRNQVHGGRGTGVCITDGAGLSTDRMG